MKNGKITGCLIVLVTIVMILTTAAVLFGCSSKNEVYAPVSSVNSDIPTIAQPEPVIQKSRIVRVTSENGVHIIEIDGHEYVSYTQGGICHLESCDCKRGTTIPKAE